MTIDVASTTQAFISEIVSVVNTNMNTVLLFTAGILFWIVAKKYIFGGTRRI